MDKELLHRMGITGKGTYYILQRGNKGTKGAIKGQWRKRSLPFAAPPGQKCQFLHTGFGLPEFALLSTLLDRHIELFDFVKLAVINAEKHRINPEEGMTTQAKSLEYIKIKTM